MGAGDINIPSQFKRGRLVSNGLYYEHVTIANYTSSNTIDDRSTGVILQNLFPAQFTLPSAYFLKILTQVTIIKVTQQIEAQ